MVPVNRLNERYLVEGIFFEARRMILFRLRPSRAAALRLMKRID